MLTKARSMSYQKLASKVRKTQLDLLPRQTIPMKMTINS